MKLSDIGSKRVIPLPVDGVFIRDLPMKQFEDLFKDAEERLKAEDTSLVVEIFQKVVCDKDGEAFEDMVDTTYEGICNSIGVGLMYEIIYSIPKVIVPEGADLGN